MSVEYWRIEHNLFEYASAISSEPMRAREVWRIGQERRHHAFRLVWGLQMSSRPLGHFPFGAHGLLMPPDTFDVLRPLIEPWVHVETDVTIRMPDKHGIRIPYSGHYVWLPRFSGQKEVPGVLAISRHQYDAMDQEVSEGDRLDTESWYKVSRIVLRRDDIGQAKIFRLPTAGLQFDDFVTDEIKSTIEEHGFTGLTFQPVELI